MEINVEFRVIRGLDEATEERVLHVHKGRIPSYWRKPAHVLGKIELTWLTEAGLAYVLAETERDAVRKKVLRYQELQANPEARIKHVKDIPALVKAKFQTAKFKWLFQEKSDGTLIPWFVESSTYHAPTQHSPIPYSTLSLSALGLKEIQTLSVAIHPTDIRKQSLSGVLLAEGFLEWDEDLMARYREQHERWMSLVALVGEQYLAKGVGIRYVPKRARHDNDIYLDPEPSGCEINDAPSKFILDCGNEEVKSDGRYGRNKTEITTRFWSTAKDSDDDFEELDSEVPQQHQILAFSLHYHNWFMLDVSNIIEYEWRDTIVDQLVLPERDKKLIQVLVKATGSNMADVVAGKSEGVIVLASGDPGLGKTLTAEVTAELLHRALYNVQCSQLGIDVAEIEDNLQTVLSRANRWGAILLIDEADVYVRSRGLDLVQNAIVGVFLRLTEYYRGFLFMATNMGTTVDDAILSRCTAHVRYARPEEDAVQSIAEKQIALLNIEADEGLAAKIAGTKTLSFSGRDVRQVLKLSKLIAEAEEKPVTAATVKTALIYQDVRKVETE